MAKQLLLDDQPRAALLRGINVMSHAVRVTPGPRGRNVVIDRRCGSPTITKDRATVAKELDGADPFENMGAQMIKEVAAKTSDVAGDGTTAATVLAQAIFREGLKHVTAGANPMALIDPTKVERIARQNAASIASLLLTTEALVTAIPDERAAPSMPPGGDY